MPTSSCRHVVFRVGFPTKPFHQKGGVHSSSPFFSFFPFPLVISSTFSPCYHQCRTMSFELPPNSLSQAELDQSNKSPIYVAVAVGFALATGGVILRAVARRKAKTTLGWDDYTIIIALVCLISTLIYGRSAKFRTSFFSMRYIFLPYYPQRSMD